MDSDYYVLAKAIPIAEIGPQLARLQMDKGPVNRSGGVNQGYLFALPPLAARLVLSKMGTEPAFQTLGLSQMSSPNDVDASNSNLDAICKSFLGDLEIAAVRADEIFVIRFVSAMLAKRFLVLTGLAGSGKD